MHYNENSEREGIVVNGESKYDVYFPKAKKGGYSVRQRKVDTTTGI